jgi:hypothetical protein
VTKINIFTINRYIHFLILIQVNPFSTLTLLLCFITIAILITPISTITLVTILITLSTYIPASSRLIQAQLCETKKMYSVKRAGSWLIRTWLLETVGAGGRTKAVPERAVRSGGATEVPVASRACLTLSCQL